jgi:hypothetical protein
METPTKHLLDSLIKAMTDDIEMLETQIASCRREEPKSNFASASPPKEIH